eukprot:CAMPEP_0202742458 /NCGR_PEP_ID=MMETSP1388-20130828/5059_1 /ASSEMBLY_ACC=CAM_ASM_000864 /TAXON_ID=37098 /ORGANISM="Isochrysis sp, Strain CCMP1244" /LENGTH=50 /DNA_ID=CAMNT_0049409383 /DNA_START=100 /DNA_END=249 /DNA_ORIENTATION=-
MAASPRRDHASKDRARRALPPSRGERRAGVGEAACSQLEADGERVEACEG